jgi:ribonuclease R
MLPSELEQKVFEYVTAPGYQSVKPRVIAKRLRLPLDQATEVRRAVKRLVHKGLLAYGADHLVVPASGVTTGFSRSTETKPEPEAKTQKRKQRGSGLGRVAPSSEDAAPATRKKDGKKTERVASAKKSNRIVGVFQRTQKGFGFVHPNSVELRSDKSQDIFVPADRTGDAATGDIVVVELKKPHPGDPGLRGVIVEIAERQTNQFVGTYFESEGTGYVRIAGTLFARPICVGDPGAKNVQADDKVVIEMIRFPSALRGGEGVITEVLGATGKPGVDTLSIIREFDLPDHFEEDAIAEAHQQVEKFDESIGNRTDFTGELIVTVDPVDARDFDDAISLEQLENGHWRLGVHIADVSHFVQPNTPLDREALDRATSVYLPDRVIPMLPEVISNGLASLQPDKVRYTKSAVMEFTPEGQRVSTELHSAAIKSTKRLTYEQVDEFLGDREGTQRKLGAKVWALLGRMHTLAMILRKRRIEQGALELDMPEVKVELDKQGQVTGAHVVENTESHQIIEEFMLAANIAVAEAIRDKEYPFLRRIHPAPSPVKIQVLEDFMAALGLPTEDLQSRFALQALLATAANRPEQYAIHFAVLRSLQRAIYSPMEEGHFALASECYCHFTSPIRRYPDLTIHRIVDAMLRKVKPNVSYDQYVVLGRHCSDREQRAEAAERDLTKLKLLAFLSTRIGEEMDAVITGVESYGIFVQGVKLPAEGLIRTESLRDDTYRFDRSTHTLEGFQEGNRYRLGDLLRVAVARVDLERRELDFRLVERKTTERPSLERKKGKKTASALPKKQGKTTKQSQSAKRVKKTKEKNAGGKPKKKQQRG